MGPNRAALRDPQPVRSRAALREPQQDRSRVTRAKLLESAVSCLAELGWSGATVAVVAGHAGVSRGATQHYFPTREDLFIAALEHMAEVRLAEIRTEAARLPAGTGAPTREVVGLLVRLYTGLPFRAALQLWAAAAARDVSWLCRWRPGSAGRRTGRPSSCWARTSQRRACTRRCRRRSTWLAASAWRTR